jgi:cellulose synthase/poly-beta-1,6-N-acetylglucosamine synthase-like glycosyltransferase
VPVKVPRARDRGDGVEKVRFTSTILPPYLRKTAYLDEPLTEGLAPEGLKEYVTQRSRWCLGMMQIARSRVGPFARNNLRLRDRWSVIDAVLYWLSTFTFRLAALTYPLLYWYFNITVVNAEPQGAELPFAALRAKVNA